jgi:hypothetical protein
MIHCKQCRGSGHYIVLGGSPDEATPVYELGDADHVARPWRLVGGGPPIRLVTCDHQRDPQAADAWAPDIHQCLALLVYSLVAAARVHGADQAIGALRAIADNDVAAEPEPIQAALDAVTAACIELGGPGAAALDLLIAPTMVRALSRELRDLSTLGQRSIVPRDQ